LLPLLAIHDRPPSFPTRRSSDLPCGQKLLLLGRREISEAQNTAACEVFCASLISRRPRSARRRIPPRVRSASRAKMRFHTRRYSDRKSTRLNSSHVKISYAVFCL